MFNSAPHILTAGSSHARDMKLHLTSALHELKPTNLYNIKLIKRSADKVNDVKLLILRDRHLFKYQHIILQVGGNKLFDKNAKPLSGVSTVAEELAQLKHFLKTVATAAHIHISALPYKVVPDTPKQKQASGRYNLNHYTVQQFRWQYFQRCERNFLKD